MATGKVESLWHNITDGSPTEKGNYLLQVDIKSVNENSRDCAYIAACYLGSDYGWNKGDFPANQIVVIKKWLKINELK